MAAVQIDIKEEARRIVEQLPPGATWADLIYQLYVRQRMDEGIGDLEAGTVTTEDLRRNLGLEQ